MLIVRRRKGETLEWERGCPVDVVDDTWDVRFAKVVLLGVLLVHLLSAYTEIRTRPRQVFGSFGISPCLFSWLLPNSKTLGTGPPKHCHGRLVCHLGDKVPGPVHVDVAT